ncbi:hypothetical protein C2E23DRAFT_351655 [Lenzites betulinus]|nr:hypothetical protein C2E23DRAFT_351655 [Lenzites betulinus]
MAKKYPLPTVVCWECKKSFKGEPACQSHASAKHHQWRLPTTPTTLATAPKPSSPETPLARYFLRSSTSTSRWTCARCGESFGAEVSFDLHYRTMHRSPNKISSATGYTVRGFVCSVCDAEFANEGRLITHRKSKNTCAPCNLHFSGKHALGAHQETYHSV